MFLLNNLLDLVNTKQKLAFENKISKDKSLKIIITTPEVLKVNYFILYYYLCILLKKLNFKVFSKIKKKHVLGQY